MTRKVNVRLTLDGKAVCNNEPKSYVTQLLIYWLTKETIQRSFLNIF